MPLQRLCLVRLLFLLLLPLLSKSQSTDSTRYSIQIASFQNREANPAFDPQQVKCVEGGDEILRCFWGNYDSYETARNHLSDLQDRGFVEAFVVILREGQRVLIGEQ